jgi:hypothetical protein
MRPVLRACGGRQAAPRQASENSENPMTRERAHPVRTRADAHPEDGYRMSSCVQRKLQCVTRKRWVPRPDRFSAAQGWLDRMPPAQHMPRFGASRGRRA